MAAAGAEAERLREQNRSLRELLEAERAQGARRGQEPAEGATQRRARRSATAPPPPPAAPRGGPRAATRPPRTTAPRQQGPPPVPRELQEELRRLREEAAAGREVIALQHRCLQEAMAALLAPSAPPPAPPPAGGLCRRSGGGCGACGGPWPGSAEPTTRRPRGCWGSGSAWRPSAGPCCAASSWGTPGTPRPEGGTPNFLGGAAALRHRPTMHRSGDLPPGVHLVVASPDLLPGMHCASSNADLLPGMQCVASNSDLPPGVHRVAPNSDLFPRMHRVRPCSDLFPSMHRVMQFSDLPPGMHRAGHSPRPSSRRAPRPAARLQAICGYRETERGRWGAAAGAVLSRVAAAFPPGRPPLGLVHVLDLHPRGFVRPHVDSVKFCGCTIAGLSLLSAAVMRLVSCRAPGEWLELLLEPGSLYVLRDAARYDFTHEILRDEESFFGGRRVPRGRRVSIICRNAPPADTTPAPPGGSTAFIDGAEAAPGAPPE